MENPVEAYDFLFSLMAFGERKSYPMKNKKR